MKNGAPFTQGNPVMSARPPVRSSSTLVDDLDKVAEITETPSRIAAQSLGEAVDPAGEKAQTPDQAVETTEKAKPAVKGKREVPWADIVNSKATQQTNYKLPIALVAKLKYLGETTYGETQTSIVRKAIEVAVAKMLKEQGLS